MMKRAYRGFQAVVGWGRGLSKEDVVGLAMLVVLVGITGYYNVINWLAG